MNGNNLSGKNLAGQLVSQRPTALWCFPRRLAWQQPNRELVEQEQSQEEQEVQEIQVKEQEEQEEEQEQQEEQQEEQQ